MKMLAAIDDSKSAMKAVEFISRQFSGLSELRITLVHVLPNLPAIFWDEGHILSDDEKKERMKVVDKWLANQKAKMEPVFRTAAEKLTKGGLPQQSIQTKFISDSTDVAESILEEAKDNGYQMIIVGRRGVSEGKQTFMGGVASRVIGLGSGIAVVVVE